MTEREIVDAIREAFADVRPGAITVHEAEVIDSYGTTEQREAARLLDVEESWLDIRDETIEECQWALPHLDPEGWRFYIPAYMIWTLTHFRACNSAVSNFTIYALAPSDEEHIREYQLLRYATLSEPQAVAVCRFLRFMADDGEHADDVVARQALERYWGRYCASPLA